MNEQENEWENAAQDGEWNQANFSMDQKVQNEIDVHHPSANEELAVKVFRYMVNFCHMLDCLVGIFFLVYAIILKVKGNEGNIVVGALIAVSVLLIIRAALGTYSVYNDRLTRLGLLVGCIFSFGMSFSMFISSVISFIMRGKCVLYIRTHQADLCFPYFLVDFFDGHVHFLWITLLCISLFEAIRCKAIANYRLFLLEEDELSLQLVPRIRRARNPWWWSRRHENIISNDDLADPLMEPTWVTSNNRSYQMDYGEGISASFWSRMFGSRSPGHDENVRDGGSVDFASVQEEWASKSEEDPFWWSRDDNENSQRRV
jgi:hypothetical protein